MHGSYQMLTLFTGKFESLTEGFLYLWVLKFVDRLAHEFHVIKNPTK